MLPTICHFHQRPENLQVGSGTGGSERETRFSSAPNNKSGKYRLSAAVMAATSSSEAEGEIAMFLVTEGVSAPISNFRGGLCRACAEGGRESWSAEPRNRRPPCVESRTGRSRRLCIPSRLRCKDWRISLCIPPPALV